MRQSHGSIQGQRKPTAVRAACIGILLLESSPFGVFLVAKTTRCLIFTFSFGIVLVCVGVQVGGWLRF